MVKCVNCGTGWTSSGLPLCPVCGVKVDAPAPAPVSEGSAVRKNGSAVVTVPPEIRTAVEEPEPPRYSFPTLQRTAAAAPEPTAAPPEPIVKEKPVEIETIDASAAHLPIQAPRILPTSSRPLYGPLILGCLAYVAVVMMPITMAFESHRVVGILGFTLAGFFAPFAPIAWIVGLAAENRRRDQGLRPERPVTLGRQLGQWGTLLLVAQTTVALVMIAAMRLSAKFPSSFWRGEL